MIYTTSSLFVPPMSPNHLRMRLPNNLDIALLTVKPNTARSLLNSELAAAGRPHLGFLNPTLYGAPSTIFNDVTTGYNGAPRSVPGTSCTTAYPAAPGWDAVSGLGTIKVSVTKQEPTPCIGYSCGLLLACDPLHS